jgi:hypothetical protein
MVYNAATAVFVRSEKGKPCLVYNGYIYLVDRQTETSTTWRCEMKNEHCKGRLRQVDNDFLDVKLHVLDSPHGHNHAANHARAERRIVQSSMYEQASTPGLSARTVWNTAAATTTAVGILHIPSISSFSRSISRKRKINNLPYPTPQKLADINVSCLLKE